MDNEVKMEIAPFLDKEKKLIKIPRKRKKLICVLLYLSDKFIRGKEYEESEINEILNNWHTFSDCATLRRMLSDMGFLDRDKSCSVYKLCEPLPSLCDFDSWIKGKGF